MSVPATITPHDYQLEAIGSLFNFWAEKPGAYPLVVMATGAGKTIFSAFLLKRLIENYPALKILFLAHRKELVEQTEDKILKVWPTAPVGVYSAALNRREIAPITVASRDTIAPAMDLLINYEPDLILVDEAHNISPNIDTRYRVLFSEFERRNANVMIAGLTATPYRATHGVIYGPDEFFDSVVFEIKIRDLVERGNLAPLITKSVAQESKIDTSEVKLSGGEFNQKQLERAAINLHMIDSAIDEWIRLAVNTGRKSTMFYCISIAHAEAVQTALAMRGFEFPMVTGKTAREQRSRRCDDFALGRIGGLINVGVFTEGTDFPIMDCLVCLRPVHSLGLWIQIAGRLMRIHPNPDVTDGLLLDFGENVERFGPIDLAQPPAKRNANAEKRTRDCPKCDTINGFYAFNCVGCGHKFKEPPHKTCENCKEPNSPSADKCIACGWLFAKHEITASSGDIMSTADRFKTVPIVGDIYCRCLISNRTKKEYLQVVFPYTLNKSYMKNIFIGYDGAAGDRALREWDRMTVPGTPLPESCEHARRIADSGNVFKSAVSVTVDTHDKYKSIKSITYAES